jgi:hypothetical protein
MPESEPRLTGASEPAVLAESRPRLIRGYLAVLADRLPASITEELADGLTETYRFHRSRGLTPGPVWVIAGLTLAGLVALLALAGRALHPALAR